MNINKVESSLLASLSHELRTPLNGIIGYLQLLSRTPLNNNQTSLINSLNNCAIRMVELVNDVLDFSKLSSGKISLNKSCFSFKELTSEVNSILDFRIKEKKQKLSFLLNKNLPEFIITDKEKLIQVLVNLISNSIKFTKEEGRIIVGISKKDPFIEVFVDDNGIGIPEEYQKDIFTPFFQGNLNTNENGCGLGLVITKKIVEELLKGSISFESQTNETGENGTDRSGTVFTFTFIYETYEIYEKNISNFLELLKEKYFLILDSNVDTRLILGEILFENGMRPIICSSSIEAVKMIQGKRYNFSGLLIESVFIDKFLSYDNVVSISNLSNFKTKFNINRGNINKLQIIEILYKVVKKDDISSFELVKDDKENSEGVTQERNPSERNPSESPNNKILITDDAVYIVDILTKMLSSIGYTNIKGVNSGEDAIKELSNNTYDVILLDLKMKNVSGIDVCKYVYENKIKTKIIVITGSILTEDKEVCKNLGVKYFLTKPINIENLKKIIRKIIYGSL
jgi:CheY-like chemotaxis protein